MIYVLPRQLLRTIMASMVCVEVAPRLSLPCFSGRKAGTRHVRIVVKSSSGASKQVEEAVKQTSLNVFAPDLSAVTLFNPLKVISQLPGGGGGEQQRSLLVYVPGMDCTGQGIRLQLPSLVAAGYDVRCVHVPKKDRSSWKALVTALIPLLEKEARGSTELILVGESFGGCLALRLARAAGDLVSRLVLVNPATNFAQNNPVASIFAQTGVLGVLSEPLYEIAQDILLPFMVKRNRVVSMDNYDLLSPIDFVPANCAQWRLSMLNDQDDLDDQTLCSIKTPTLILSSAKDRVLSSLEEGLRLQKLLPNATRRVLPDSGHIALLEDGVNLASILKEHGVSTSPSLKSFEGQEDFSDDRMDELGKILGPWRLLTSPLVSGTENLPSPSAVKGRSVLFVGNHTTFGAYDSAILVHELYLRGFKCRSLAHPAHWLTAVGPLFQRYGSVKATKFETYRLLKEGQHVLLFPGGSREVCKLKGEEYQLLDWKPDFVRMAMRLNAIIVPFGALGGDDAYKVLYDRNDILRGYFGGFVRQVYESLKLSPEDVQPVSAFPFTNLPSPIPVPYSLQRIYVHFGECVDTGDISANVKNREECQALCELIKKRVNQSIQHLKQARATDPEQELGDRLTAKLRRILPERRRSN